MAALLFAVSRASPPLILGLLIFAPGAPILLPRLVRLLLTLSLLPGMAAALLRRVFAADASIGGPRVVLVRRGLYQRGQRIELDPASIERLEVWRVPLPGPGVSVWTASDSSGRLDIHTDDLTTLLRPLEARRNLAKRGESLPAIAHADARRAIGLPRWYHLVGKYGLFPLLPTVVFFRLHQHIMYGGLLGQYYLEGLRPYLSTFAFHWIMVLIYVLMYASVWRVLAEGTSLAAAHIAPARALDVRRWSERAVRILYFGGVPALVALRFLV